LDAINRNQIYLLILNNLNAEKHRPFACHYLKNVPSWFCSRQTLCTDIYIYRSLQTLY